MVESLLKMTCKAHDYRTLAASVRKVMSPSNAISSCHCKYSALAHTRYVVPVEKNIAHVNAATHTDASAPPAGMIHMPAGTENAQSSSGVERSFMTNTQRTTSLSSLQMSNGH
jgi:hypothetical protein